MESFFNYMDMNSLQKSSWSLKGMIKEVFFSKFGLEHKSRLNDRCFDSSESMECSSGSFLISRLSQLVNQAANDRTIFFAVVFDMWQGFYGLRYLPECLRFERG